MMENIIDFSTVMVNQCASFYFYRRLTGLSPKYKIIHIFIMMSFGVIQILLNLYSFKTIGTIFTIVYFYYMFINIYKSTPTQSQNYSIIIWLISLLWDIFVMLIINTVNLIHYYEQYPTITKSIGSITMALAQLAIANNKFLLKKLNNLYTRMCKLKISRRQILYIGVLYLLLGLISSINLKNRIVLISFTIGIMALWIILRFIEMKYRIMTLKKTNELLEKNNEVYAQIITDYRILKHNLENHLLGIKTVSNKTTRKLLDELIKEHNNSFYIKHDINSMPFGINGLLLEKLYYYRDYNIETMIHNEITGNILKKIGPREYNLFCNALGISLDNALESTIKCTEKMIFIEFKETPQKITIRIINTFKNRIDLDKLGTRYYTSKKEGHGLGLYSLFDKKRITIFTKINNNKFINTISVIKTIRS